MIKSWFSRWYLNIKGSLFDFFSNLFSILGALWTFVEILSFFYKDWGMFLENQGVYFLGLAFVFTLAYFKPQNVYKCILANRDITIEIRIGDIFNTEGAIIIPSNTTFDTDLNGRISKAQSVQGEFLRRYYEGNCNALDKDIQVQLEIENYQYINNANKKIGNIKQYSLGDIISLRVKNRLFYLMALTHISDEGRALGQPNDIPVALKKLWDYISKKGDKCDVVIPIIGTGYARLPLKREDIIKQIIFSFVQSVMTKKYCDKLTVIIHPNDVVKYQIDIQYLYNFLKNTCKEAEFWHQIISS